MRRRETCDRQANSVLIRSTLACRYAAGYTIGMKTAVSIPDSVFAKTDRYAQHVKKSRSQIVSEALREYLARHAPDEVTDAMDHAIDTIGDQRDPFVTRSGDQILSRQEW